MKTRKTILKRILSGFIAAAMCMMNMAGMFDPEDIRNALKVFADDDQPSGDNGPFRISGTVEFDDGEWSNLVRPPEFDQKIVVVLQYKDKNSELKEIRNYAQEDMAQLPFYLKFVHDGNGAGNFIVENVPRKITVDGEEYDVTGCYAEAGIDSGKYPYYENRAADDSHNGNVDENTVIIDHQIYIGLKTSVLLLDPVVKPENSTQDQKFEMNVTFTNKATKNEIKDKKYTVSAGDLNNSGINVPVGIDFKVAQNLNKTQDDGFEFDGRYTVTEGETKTEYNDAAAGTIKSGIQTTVTTLNYNQNMKKDFNVLWIDNLSTARPQTNEELFDIMYTTDSVNWHTVSDGNIDLKRLKFNAPAADQDQTQYSFTGLPSRINIDGNDVDVDYKVVPKSPYPDRYMVSQDGNNITFIEKSDFTAAIKWNDAYTRDKRPDADIVKSFLKLKRRLSDETDAEDMDMSKLRIEKTSEDLWTITVDGLERYSSDNHEYDYYIEYLSEVTEGDITLKHYIDNAGNYHSDTVFCHNGGTITEVLSDFYSDDFKASIEWKDPETDGKRPDPTVTLWRYVDTGKDKTPDDAYKSGDATQVIFQKNNEDKIVSYKMQPGDTDIIFNSNTVKDLPADYRLPMYDDHGNKYIYFVRESLSGENAEKYEIINNSAPEGSKITNVRREKAAVTIKKIWKNPDGLEDINGAAVQFEISDSDGTPLTVYSPENRSYEKLTGDELKAAQTINGFSSMVPSLEVTYYVNICDDDGKQIDMSRIRISETVSRPDETPSYSSDNYISVNNNTYKTETGYMGSPVTLADGTKEYRYTQTNTIFAFRNYEVIKEWDPNITNKNDIQSINFRIERCLLKDLHSGNNEYEFVKYAEVPCDSKYSEKSREYWKTAETLLKYNEDGYEYYYRAVEESFNMKDGRTEQRIVDSENNFRGWATQYHREPNQTRAYNYIPNGGGGYITITKNWQDNGDKSNRPDVYVKVFKKTELEAYLSKLGADDLFNWSSELKCENVILSSDPKKNYTAEFSYPEGNRKSDYITLEYKVGTEGAEPAEYRAGDILNFIRGNSMGFEGTVKNSSRSYKAGITKDKENDVFISNTRTGVTKIEVGKQWKDGNVSAYRPVNIKFRLYLNNTAYNSSEGRGIPQDVEITGATIDSNGIITVTPNNDGNWNFTINKLPMFSESGMVNYYNVEEEPITEKNGVNYISKRENVKSEEGSDHQTQNVKFDFSNTAVGTIDYTVYKKWNDRSIDPDKRPDIYFSLYRYLEKDKDSYYDAGGKFIPGELQPVTDCGDQIWTADPVVDGKTYDWEITVPDLPRFDKDGNEYGYAFTEKINNNGVTVFGKYEQTKDTVPYNGTDYDLFVNTITGEVEITGKKTWSGLAKYYKSNDDLNAVLPDPVIELYRNSEDKPCSTTKLNEEKTGYSFSNLPKYDKNGEKYKYTVSEKFSDDITRQLYTNRNLNGTLLNIFKDNINRRKISVTKKWQRGDNIRPEENKYPSVTYNLYRYEEGTEISKAELIETIKIPSIDFNSANGEKTVVFDDLLVCSPRGKYYNYYVTEECGNNGGAQGYTIEYYDENNNKQEKNRIDISNADISPNEENSDNNKKSISTLNKYDRKGNVTLIGDKEWDDYNDLYGLRPGVDTFELTLKRYTENETDENNKVQNTNIIYRTIGEPKLECKDSADPECKTPYIVWSGTKTNKWTYTIYNLERYAPNGMPYIYVLSEDSVPGYKKAGDAAADKIKNDSSDGITEVAMKQMTNSFDGVCELRKNWFDGYNKYGLRPDSITVVLQRKTGENGKWEDVKYDEKMGDKLPHVYNDVVSVTLTKDNAIKNTRNDSSWGYSFRNLPLADSNGEKISYQCIEIMIGGVKVKSDGTAGSYKTKLVYDTENKPVIENTLSDTSLFIEKRWLNDNNDLYSSRPESLELKLQKKVTDQDGKDLDNADWIDVNVDGKSTFMLRPDSSGNWTMELKDLPVAQIIKSDDDNSFIVYSLRYRAVEVTKEKIIGESAVKVVSGAENYKDVTQEEDHLYNNNNSRNESTITNELLLSENSVITVKKQWYSESTGAEAVLELQYRIKSSDPKNPKPWNSYKNELINCSTCSNNKLESFTWTKLPKYDREGNELEYQVIEHPVSGYKTTLSNDSNTWSFINTELQSYTVKKIWKNADYAHKEGNNFTAEFKLQHSLNGIEWIDTEVDSAGKKVEPIILQSDKENDEKSDTWNNLLKYDSNGTQIIYRAVETKINGKDVAENTNGDYIVTYSYDNGSSDPSFGGTETTATNRMIYGFVNLSKAAAYLKPEITDSENALKDVVFDIYRGDESYASGIKTSAEGNLIRNTDGTYGDEHRYLITGEYIIKERYPNLNPDFSVWEKGVSFKVGNTGGTVDTGEHGTAWIKTDGSIDKLNLYIEYLSSGISDPHSYNDICGPASKESSNAFNIESRGIIKFAKKGDGNNELDIHEGAAGESQAYFGVYLDSKCETYQVAGMVPSSGNKGTFVLTDKKQDGGSLEYLKNERNIPYLREYGEVGYSLLSGTYYIKELAAPAGYKLDGNIRTAVIKKIEHTEINTDLSGKYGSNIAFINGDQNYSWPNTPNKVTVCKMDQYGRKVDLSGKHLVLSIQDGSRLPGGVQHYDLYQDSTHNTEYIKYNAADKSWTITGLFDISNTYTLSEPDDSVPEKNVKAENILFKVDAAGNMIIQESSAQSVSDPLSADGDDYKNYYRAAPDNNIVVMRDVSRYFKNVELEKYDSVNKEPIPNISFKLYRYDRVENGEYKDVVPVLEEGVLLTTDGNGKIDLSKIQGVKNLITGCEIKYGLDMGNYYFEEVERGASDKYRLLDKIKFEIVANSGSKDNYEDFARVTYEDFVGNKVENDPVTKYPKTLELTKKDSEKLLPGARFTLKYTSVNKGQQGADPDSEYNCVTAADGQLYIADANWNATSIKPDISRKGTYVLEEILASDHYMTPTYSKVTITFKVDSENIITVTGSTGELISTDSISENSLSLTAENQKTVVKLSKLNDIYDQVKTKDQKDLTGEQLIGADLRIYEGETEKAKLEPTRSSWTLTGVLKENTEYILREAAPPVGYMAADDIKFRFFGTNAANESVLQVWNGTDWVASQNLKNNTLTMVDEAIIAPVDMQKVVGDSTYAILPGARFEVKTVEGNLGTAVSDSNGWLVWESEPVKNGEVFNSSGKRAGSSDNLAGTKIILQQNTHGYTFTEIYAPDNAYNNGGSWTVNITADQYKAYKDNSGYYVDIRTNEGITARIDSAAASDLVNPQYKSTVTLYKYDADEEGQNAPIADTEFTLYRGSVEKGKYTTNSAGNITVTINEKGTYTLIETKAATGYKLDPDNPVTFTFTLQDKSDDEDKAENIFGYNETNTLSIDNNGVPNERLKGSVTLVKMDEKTNQPLSEVVYTLTRTGVPTAPEKYQLKESAEVKTGHKYTAVNTNGIWTLSEAPGTAGKLEIEGLNWSSYKLVEKTENSGYVLDQKELAFTISAANLEVNVTDDGKQYVSNVRNKVTFKKTNMEEAGIFTEEQIKGLSGAVFEVHDSSDNIVEFYASETEKTEKVKEVTSGPDGTVTIYGLPTDTSSDDSTVTYKLVEKTAPKGYKLQRTPVEFTVDRFGNVKIDNTDAEKLVKMQDEAIKIRIKKFGEDSDALDGAEFELKDSNGEKLADGSDKLENITVNTRSAGTTMIPVEKLIGGHSYTLTETKAPDGYECTAVVNFTVDEDGKVTALSSTGGFGDTCASVDDEKTTISIKNEKIRAEIIKTETGKPDTKLEGVEFEIEGTFTNGTTKFTRSTSAGGIITIDAGLLIHGNKYTIKETQTISGYYIYKELSTGVTVTVEKDGTLTIPDTAKHIESSGDRHIRLFIDNAKSASFELTKKVEGNMGDLTGEFQINMEVYETETDPDQLAEKTVVLRLNEKYDSEKGKQLASDPVKYEPTVSFGKDAIPVGAKLVISEDNALDYSARLSIINASDGQHISEVASDKDQKGKVSVILNSGNKFIFELVNTKNVVIDVGVKTESQSPLAVAAVMIPAAWLLVRSGKRRRRWDML